MKSFKETFELISNRLRNLNAIITSCQINIANPEAIGYHKQYQSELDRALIERDNLLLQNKQLRDLIINDKQ